MATAKEKASFNFFKEFANFVEKHGIFRTIMYIVVFIGFSIGIYVARRPEILFEKYERYVERKHTESFTYRMRQTPVIQATLDVLRNEAGANRVFIIEMHNGKQNASGLSFTYGSLTYESKRVTTTSIFEDYKDFTLERYPTIGVKVYGDGYWAGTVEEVEKIDEHLAYRLRSNNTEFIAGVMMYGEYGAIGLLGISYARKEDVDRNLVRNLSYKYIAKIAPLLDGANAHAKKK